MKEKPLTDPVTEELPVPRNIQEMFSAANIARSLAEDYARAAAGYLADAWDAWDELHKQRDGYYWAHNGGGLMRRHKRPPPDDLVQK
jgi:hypothetical protein